MHKIENVKIIPVNPANIIQALYYLLQNRAGTAFFYRNDNDDATAMTKQQKSKDAMDACQDTKKVIDDAPKTHLSLEVPSSKLDGAINKGDKRSIEPVDYQEKESSINENQSRHVERQGGGSWKRKLDNRENKVSPAIGIDRGFTQGDQSRPIGRIKPHAIFSPDEKKTVRNRLGSGTEGKLSSRRHVSSAKYASFLRILRREETDERLRNSSSQGNDGEKPQRSQRELPAERYIYDTWIPNTKEPKRRINEIVFFRTQFSLSDYYQTRRVRPAHTH